MRTKLWITLAAGTLFLLPAMAATATTTKASEKTAPYAWTAQTLSGKISMVVPKDHLVVITDNSGTPFDLEVTPGTAIRSGSARVTLEQLNNDVNQGVSVRFVPERSGDIAQSIRLGQ